MQDSAVKEQHIYSQFPKDQRLVTVRGKELGSTDCQQTAVQQRLKPLLMKRLQLSHQQQVCDQAEPVTSGHFIVLLNYTDKQKQEQAGLLHPHFLHSASLDHCWLSVVLGLSLGLAGPWSLWEIVIKVRDSPYCRSPLVASQVLCII